jgi:PAS domain S-box-containing protein
VNFHDRLTKAELIVRAKRLEAALKRLKSSAASSPDEALMRANAALRREAAEHQRDLRALRAIEQRQALILRSLPMTVYAAEPHGDFGITWITANSERVTGFPPAEFMAAKNFWASRIHPDDRDHVLRVFSAISQDGFIAVEYRWRCADGTYHWFLDQAMLVRQRRRGGEIIGTWLDISRRKRLEKEILEIREREQRRIGHDLHDDLCQQLASIEFLSQALKQALTSAGREEATKAAEIARLVRQAITHTHELARGLSPVELQAEGLMVALEQLATRVSKLMKIKCRFRCDSPVPVDSEEASTHFYRIAQEAVSNAIKHGRAQEIEIALSRLGHRIVLSVQDNGSGMAADLSKCRGMGLATMQYRAGMMNGSLTIQRLNGKGTVVLCSAPFRSQRPLTAAR